MATQLTSGLTGSAVFADSGPGAVVNASRLNQHVNGAALLNGAVIDQVRKIPGSGTPPLGADSLLLGDSTQADTGTPCKVLLSDLLLQSQRDGTQRWGGTAGGTANALTIATTPVSAGGYVTGEVVRFLVGASANTGAVTINLDGRNVVNLYAAYVTGVAALTGGELMPGMLVEAAYDGTEFVIIGLAKITSAWLSQEVRAQSYCYDGAAGGSANAHTINPVDSAGNHAFTGSLPNGLIVRYKSGFSNTGALTLAVCLISAVSVVDASGNALIGGEVKSGSVVEMVYDSSAGKFYLLASKVQFTATAVAIPFQSNQYTNTQTAHGFSAPPRKVRVVMVCSTNDGAWVVGDQVDISAVNSNQNAPVLLVWADATYINVARNCGVSNTLTLPAKTAANGSGSTLPSTSITPANWRLNIYAEP